jgi:hypothetical protein
MDSVSVSGPHAHTHRALRGAAGNRQGSDHTPRASARISGRSGIFSVVMQYYGNKQEGLGEAFDHQAVHLNVLGHVVLSLLAVWVDFASPW